MKSFLFVILFSLTGALQAQGECLMSFVSNHYITNYTAKTVTIWVNNRNQESFPTAGPEQFIIAPNTRIKVADLEWAEEFRDPTNWFVFKIDTEGLTPLCDKKNWQFQQIDKTTGEYNLTLAPSIEEPCEKLDDAFFFADRTAEEPVEIDEEIIEFPEKEAQFPGGTNALIKWIRANRQYPPKALENGIEGKVYVEFVVGKTGKLSDIKILRSPDDLLSQEAIRLIKAMPKWEPGQRGNKPVATRYRLPFKFQLD